MPKNGRSSPLKSAPPRRSAKANPDIPRHFFEKWVPDTRPTLTRRCDHPECSGVGEYRAPITATLEENNPLHSDGAARRFFMFCLEHVKQYNESWDYYKGMSAEELEEATRFDGVWNRPTWPVGGGNTVEDKIRKAFNTMFSEDGGPKAKTETPKAPPTFHRKAEIDALAELGLAPPVDFAAIKKSYRMLVKKHHPDVVEAHVDADDKIKRLNSAFTFLKTIYLEEESS